MEDFGIYVALAALFGLWLGWLFTATGSLLADDLTDDPLRASGGTITLSDDPGLGIGSLNPELSA